MDLFDMLLQEDDIEEAVGSSLFDDSDSSSGDEDFELARQFVENNEVENDNDEDYFEDIKHFSEEEFITIFRMNRKKVLELLEGYKNSDITKASIKRCNSSLPHINKEETILIFLWFAGHTNIHYRDVARQFKISIGAVFRIISDVSKYLNRMAGDVISWPQYMEEKFSRVHYVNETGIPNIIGCMGYTSISISKPLDHYKDLWESGENFHFILQAVCNEKHKFLDIFVASPGVTELSMVFVDSPLSGKLMEKQDFCVISSSSTNPVMKNVITPYEANRRPLTPKELKFNKRLIDCCSDVDNTFDLLKKRFKQLYYVKLRDPKRIINFINACCVLHNIADKEDHIYFIDEESMLSAGKPSSKDLVGLME